MSRLNALVMLNRDAFQLIYSAEAQRNIAELVNIIGTPDTYGEGGPSADQLARMDVLLTGWGTPTADEAFLARCPRLKAIFLAAGAAGHVATPVAWERGIVVSSAYAANAVPVAEYTLATIVFSLKHGWQLARQTREQRKFVPRDHAPGCFRRTVGLVSLGMIARTLLKLLKPLDLEVLAYDPFVSPAEAEQLGVKLVSLDELFTRCDVVSVHTPSFVETRGLITGRHLDSMRPGSTFINTSRGEVVAEGEMIEVLTRRGDLYAVLDVMEKEPADSASPLFDLPNVTITPHIAGSVGQECNRMAYYMVDELRRYLAGEPLKWAVTPELAWRSTHRTWIKASTRPVKVAVASALAGRAPGRVPVAK